MHFGYGNRGMLSDKLHRYCFCKLLQSPNFNVEVLRKHKNGAMAGQNTSQKSKRREHEKPLKGSIIDTKARVWLGAFGR